MSILGIFFGTFGGCGKKSANVAEDSTNIAPISSAGIVNSTVPTPSTTSSPSIPTMPPPIVATHSAKNTQSLRDSVEEQIDVDKYHQIFPKETHLLTVTLEDGVATLNFNKNFNKLSTMGDSTESEAQKKLRNALAPFSNVEKMRVLVENKPFDSQMTDWTIPFAVRNGDMEKVVSGKK